MSDLAPGSAPVPLLEITSERAIALVRWWVRVGVLFNVLMFGLVVAVSLVGYSRGLGTTPVFLAGLLWFGVLVASVKARRLAVDAAPLIAAGEFGLAEDRLSQSLRSFSILRSAKLLGLQQLAMLRHVQGRWADAAMLSRELLDRAAGRRADRDIETPARLMLAEASVELGDARGAEAQLVRLAWTPLPLRETLVVTGLRLELEARAGRWQEMMRHVEASLTLAELMPSLMSARCHALLALAARKTGNEPWRAMLARRARLLSDTEALIAGRPFLREAFDDDEELNATLPG